jgi:cytochrome c553
MRHLFILPAACRGLAGSLLLTLCSASTFAANPPGPGGDAELGRYLASECTACHQISGRTVGSIPAIVAWPQDQFIAVMQAYRDRQRDNAVMQNIAGKLKDEEIAALAAYFGALVVKPGTR